MNRKWLLLPLAIAVAVPLVWFASGPEQRAAVTSALGFKPAPVAAQRQKPICSDAIAPVGDCIPQHMANLPPDPGLAGELTVEGIDSDKDKVRDDVQRQIEEKYGESRRAVAALRLVAVQAQEMVVLGDSLSREETYQVAIKNGADIAWCYANTVPDEIRAARAAEHVRAWVRNTRERNDRYVAFDNLTNNRIFLASEREVPEACGYDPAALPN